MELQFDPSVPFTLDPVADPVVDRDASIRVVIIDDHPFFRTAARLIIEIDVGITVVGEASNAAEARALMHTKPDVALLDMDLGETDGLELLSRLLKVNQHTRFI